MMLLENEEVLSVAVYPSEGRIFWIRKENGSAHLEGSAMDGSSRKILVPDVGDNAKSLVVDLEGNR